MTSLPDPIDNPEALLQTRDARGVVRLTLNRPDVRNAFNETTIAELARAFEGLGRSDVLKFWFGESDEVTPDFIREAAIASLQHGETFYAHNLGLPELRHAIAGYLHGLHPQQHTVSRRLGRHSDQVQCANRRFYGGHLVVCIRLHYGGLQGDGGAIAFAQG